MKFLVRCQALQIGKEKGLLYTVREMMEYGVSLFANGQRQRCTV
jgi:hypothetical protein